MKSILVLGSGQLGLMMAEAAIRYGIQVDRFDLATNEVIHSGSQIRHQADIEQLLSSYDVISAELEHLPDTEIVQQICSSDRWVNHDAFTILPKRHTQKQFLDDAGIATAPWEKVDSKEQLSGLFESLSSDIVFKTTQGGYDGKGQWVLNADEIDQLPDEVIGHLIAEAKIPFDLEVSLIAARNSKGQTSFYPLTYNYHDGGILRYSIAPYDNAALQEQAEAFLGKIMQRLDYVGVMGMECFVAGDQLMVNELAPRVHNSGHWTQYGANYNQFDLHVRALAGMDLIENQAVTPSVMLNLIGCDYSDQWWQIDPLDVHWYGKEKRPGRKLGHINAPQSLFKDTDKNQSVLATLDSAHQAYWQQATALLNK